VDTKRTIARIGDIVYGVNGKRMVISVEAWERNSHRRWRAMHQGGIPMRTLGAKPYHPWSSLKNIGKYRLGGASGPYLTGVDMTPPPESPKEAGKRSETPVASAVVAMVHREPSQDDDGMIVGYDGKRRWL